MIPPRHEPFDRLVWHLAAWIYGDPDRSMRCTVFRLAMLSATVTLAAVVIRHADLPLRSHRIGVALWLVAATVTMRGERAWGDPRLGAAAAAGLAAAIGFIAWLALLKG